MGTLKFYSHYSVALIASHEMTFFQLEYVPLQLRLVIYNNRL